MKTKNQDHHYSHTNETPLPNSSNSRSPRKATGYIKKPLKDQNMTQYTQESTKTKKPVIINDIIINELLKTTNHIYQLREFNTDVLCGHIKQDEHSTEYRIEIYRQSLDVYLINDHKEAQLSLADPEFINQLESILNSTTKLTKPWEAYRKWEKQT